MDQFSRHELRSLIGARQHACVSMFLPMHRKARDVNENRIRAKNAIGTAEQQLLELGVAATAARAILQPARDLEANNDFWLRQSDGLAVFAGPEEFHTFRAPLNFVEAVHVGHRFHVRPLLPLVQGDGTFYILAASQKLVRLFRGTHYSVSELEVESLPQNLQEALNVDEWKAELTHQSFPAIRVGREGATVSQGFHGHGNSADVTKNDELREFFVRINDGLDEFFGEESDPLVFAGVEYLFPIFRDACHYRRLVRTPITGNPDGLSAEELHGKAWQLVEPLFQQGRESSLQRFGDGVSHGMGGYDAHEILEAARIGRVDTLLINRQSALWGLVDEERGSVTPLEHNGKAGAVDLVDYAATQTLLTGGSVYEIEPERMPNGAPMAAIYRYRAEETGGEPDRNDRAV